MKLILAAAILLMGITSGNGWAASEPNLSVADVTRTDILTIPAIGLSVHVPPELDKPVRAILDLLF
jgi:hypothetical protein